MAFSKASANNVNLSTFFQEDNEIVLDYSLLNEGIVLRSNTVSYKLNDKLYVDLFLISDILGLNISIDAVGQMMLLSVLGESNRIQVDFKNCQYLKKEIQTYNCNYLAINDLNKAYITTELLSQFFKIDFVSDYKNGILYFNPHQNFPLFTKLLRTNLVNDSEGERNDYQLIRDNQSSLFKGFTARLNENQQYNRGQSTLQNSSVKFNLLVDKMELSALYNNQNYRWLSVERNFFENDSGEKYISNFKVGNFINGNEVFLLGSQKLSGIYFTNKNENEVDSNMTINIEGNLAEGYDVDLYKNEQLIDQFKDVRNGRYLFKNKKLGIGKNLFKLIFYGPRGEIYEEYKNYNVDAEKFNKKDSYTFYTGKSEDDKRYDLLKYKTIIGELFYFSPTYFNITHKNTSKKYFSLDQSFVLNNVVISDQITASKKFEGNKLSLLVDLNETSLVFDHTIFSKDSSNEILKINTAQVKSEKKLSFSSRLFSFPNLRNNFLYNYRNYWGKSDTQKYLRNTTSFNYNKFYIDNSLEYELGSPIDSLLSTSNIVWASLQHQYQARLDFSVLEKIKGISFEYRFQKNDKLTFSSGIYAGLLPDSSSANVGFGYSFQTFKLGLNSSISSQNFSANVSFETSFFNSINADTDKAKIKFDSSFSEESAIVYITTFRDDNANGVLDPGEGVIAGVDILFVSTGEVLTTNKSGRLVYSKAIAHQPLYLKIQEESLPDLNLTITKKIKFYPRKAGINSLLIPIQTKYAITGTVTKKKHEGFSEKKRVYVYSEKLDLVQIARVDEDSEFIIEGLQSGQYILSSTEILKNEIQLPLQQLKVEIGAKNVDLGTIDLK